MLSGIVLISLVQESESAIWIHMSPLFWTSFPSRSPQYIKQSSLSYTVGSHLVIHFIHGINMCANLYLPIHPNS